MYTYFVHIPLAGIQINYTEEMNETKDVDKYSFANMYPGVLHKETVVNYSL